MHSISNKKKVIISYHDYHQSSYEILKGFHDSSKKIGLSKVSILAVPKMHNYEILSQFKDASEWLLNMEKQGNDICLHGFLHKVNTVKGGLISRLIGNFYTNREGEFLNIKSACAHEKLVCGLDILKDIGITPKGFTPPAWLISKEGIIEVKNMGFHYLTTLNGVFLLKRNTFVKAPVIVLSSRGNFRRYLSKKWIKIANFFFRDFEIIRFAIHPIDLVYNDIKKQIAETLENIISYREPITYLELCEKYDRKKNTH